MVKEAKIILGYGRVSTAAQAGEDKTSLAEQRRAVEHYCREHGWQLVAWFEDVVSGAEAEEENDGHTILRQRPGLSALMEQAREGTCDAVMVYKLDRLARSVFLAAWLQKELLKLGGREIVSVVEPTVEDELLNKLLRQVVSAFAEFERGTITRRLTNGRRAKVREGGYGGGWLPYGYRVEGSRERAKIVVDKRAAEIVKRTFREYARGRSMAAVAEGLNADGLPTRRGGKWRPSTVGTILRNTFYAGAAERTEGNKRNGHKPIISRQLFGRCRAAMKKRAKRPGRGER